jgi:hypothetical protein
MRATPVFMRVLAQFSKFQPPSELRDGLKLAHSMFPCRWRSAHSPNRILAQFHFLGQPSS